MSGWERQEGDQAASIAPSKLAEAVERGECSRFLRRAFSRGSSRLPAHDDDLHGDLVSAGVEAETAIRAQLAALLGADRGRSAGRFSLDQLIDELGPPDCTPLFGEQVRIDAVSTADFVILRRLLGRVEITIIECKSASRGATRHLMQLGAYMLRAGRALNARSAEIRGVLVRRRADGSMMPLDLESGPSEAVPEKAAPLSASRAAAVKRDVEALEARARSADAKHWTIGAACRGCRHVGDCITEAADKFPVRLLGVDWTGVQAIERVLGDAPITALSEELLAEGRRFGMRGGTRALLERTRVVANAFIEQAGPEVRGVTPVRMPDPDVLQPLLQMFVHPLRFADGRLGAVAVGSHVGREADWTNPPDIIAAVDGQWPVSGIARRLSQAMVALGAGYVHLYAWEARTIRELGAAAATSAAPPDQALARFLGQAEELAEHLGEDIPVDAAAELAWTALQEEFRRKYAAASFGTGLRDAVSLKWAPDQATMARDWATQCGSTDAGAFRRDLLFAPATDDEPIAHADPAEAVEALGRRCLASLRWVERQMRLASQGRAAVRKRLWQGDCLAQIEPEHDAPWLAGARQFQHIEAVRAKNRWLFQALSTPDELLARGHAVELVQPVWQPTQDERLKIMARIAVVPPGRDPSEADVERFRDGKTLSLRLVPFTSPFDQIDADELRKGVLVGAGTWKTARAPKPARYRIEDGQLELELAQYRKSQEPEYPGTPCCDDTTLAGREVFPGLRVIGIRDYRLNAERKIVALLSKALAGGFDDPLRRKLAKGRWLLSESRIPDAPALPALESAASRLLRHAAIPVSGRKQVFDIFRKVFKSRDARSLVDAWHAARHVDLASFPPDPVDQAVEARRLETINHIQGGLARRLMCVQGPPGTGKTEFASLAILTFLSACEASGAPVVVVTGNTHKSINNLLNRTLAQLPIWNAPAVRGDGPPIYPRLYKVEPVGDDQGPLFRARDEKPKESRAILGEMADLFVADISVKKVGAEVDPDLFPSDSAIVLGCTVQQFSKFLEAGLVVSRPCDLLVVDEASMMLLPSFVVALGAMHADGRLLIVGDDRQMPPIVDESWRSDLTPDIRRFAPWRSVYEAFDRAGDALYKVGLPFSHRLPFDLWRLVAPMYVPGLALSGRPPSSLARPKFPEHLLSEDWEGICVATYDGASTYGNVNRAEIAFVSWLLGTHPASVDAENFAIVTPYRRQIAALREALEAEDLLPQDMIVDSVERLQGDERPVVIYSAVADWRLLASSPDFLIDRARANVAFTRAERKLFVICSRDYLNFVPADFDLYAEIEVWKRLRELLSREAMTKEIPVDGGTVNFSLHYLDWTRELQ